MKAKPNAAPRLLTKEQLAPLIGLKARGVETLTKRGKIPALKISHRCVRYDLEKVLAALARYEQPAVRGCS